MNKKSWITLLVLVLVLSTLLFGCGKKSKSESSSSESKSAATSESGQAAKTPSGAGQIIIGTNTQPDGNWNAWGYWGDNATDNDIYNLTNDMSTVQNDFSGDLKINKTVVDKVDVKKNADGTKTYLWKIKDGLKYSDGTPITAKDFAAGILFASPQFKLFNAKDQSEMYKLVGYDDYHDGVKKEFSGVKLPDAKTVAITLDKKHLPDFYEQITAAVTPVPYKKWVGNDVEIKDDGQGCYFTGDFSKLVTYGERKKDAKGNPVEPPKTDEQKKLFDKYSKMVKAARDAFLPSSGPYVLKKFDKATKEVVLDANPNYPGNYEGKKPTIKTVVIRLVKSATAIDQLKTGEVDVLREMMSGSEINAGISLAEAKKAGYITYPRAGYGMLQFVCDFGPTRFKEVRQAVAHLLDRQDFVQKFTGGFGVVVDGPYGEGQWFYKKSEKELKEKLNHYSYSLEKAVSLLEKAGYTLNEKGEAFKPGTDKLRYRKDEKTGKLEPLILKWASTKDNPVSETLVVTLQKNKDVAAAGMKIEQDVMDFSELLGYYNRSKDKAKYTKPKYNMFNLAAGFPVGYLPTKEFTTDPEEVAQGFNPSYLLDKDLDKLARAVKKHDPSDREGYRKDWVKYIEKWNELLPLIPLYSNTIHDFYSTKVKDYTSSAAATMPMILTHTTLAK